MNLAAEQRERQEAQRQREKELAAVKVGAGVCRWHYSFYPTTEGTGGAGSGQGVCWCRSGCCMAPGRHRLHRLLHCCVCHVLCRAGHWVITA